MHLRDVPNNDSDKTFDRQERLTSKVAQPHRLCDGDTANYLWPIEESDGMGGRRHADVLCRTARHLLALGWGIDQVVGNGRVLTDVEAAALPGRHWRAWNSYRPGMQRWRVPTGDSLDDLERVHKSFLQRVDGKQYHAQVKLSEFDTVDYITATTLPPRPYAVFELPEGVAFRQEATAKVAAVLRSLASRCAREDTHEFPGGSEIYVAGHTGKQNRTAPRFSYLPVPSIRYERSDGMIRRVLIAEPFGADGAHVRWAQNRLSNATLQDQDGNDRGVLFGLWRPVSKAMIRRYVDAARIWCTVTPVVLPGFDDGKRAKAETLFFAAVRQADLPVDGVAEITLRKAPFWPGSQHPRQYFLPDYLRHFPGWHVRIAFQEPVPGPLAIGAGRHAGLGVLAAWEK